MSEKRLVVLALGSCYATPGAMEHLSRMEILGLLRKQALGDWGDTCSEDCAANDAAVLSGGARVVALHVVYEERFFVITEADRSATTVMLASEY